MLTQKQKALQKKKTAREAIILKKKKQEKRVKKKIEQEKAKQEKLAELKIKQIKKSQEIERLRREKQKLIRKKQLVKKQKIKQELEKKAKQRQESEQKKIAELKTHKNNEIKVPVKRIDYIEKLEIEMHTHKALKEKVSTINRISKQFFSEVFGFSEHESFDSLLKKLEKAKQKKCGDFCSKMIRFHYDKTDLTREKVDLLIEDLIKLINSKKSKLKSVQN